LIKHERSVLRTGIAVLGAIVVGGALLLLSYSADGRWYQRLLNDFGSIIIASIALVLIFDYWQKEAFFRELFQTAKFGAELKSSGLTGFSSSFQDDIDWDDLFKSSSHLDIFFVYGQTWRNNHVAKVESLLSRDKTRVRVVLPNPGARVVMDEIALRFNYDVPTLQSKIEKARSYFERLGTKYPGKVEIFYLSRSMTHSYYRFNSAAVLALYSHHPDRSAVPTFTANRGGDIYKFIRDEWYSVIENGVEKGYTLRVFPKS